MTYRTPTETDATHPLKHRNTKDTYQRMVLIYNHHFYTESGLFFTS